MHGSPYATAVANSPRAAGNEGPSNQASVTRGFVGVAYSHPAVAATSTAAATMNSPTTASACRIRLGKAPTILIPAAHFEYVDHALELPWRPCKRGQPASRIATVTTGAMSRSSAGGCRVTPQLSKQCLSQRSANGLRASWAPIGRRGRLHRAAPDVAEPIPSWWHGTNRPRRLRAPNDASGLAHYALLIGFLKRAAAREIRDR